MQYLTKLHHAAYLLSTSYALIWQNIAFRLNDLSYQSSSEQIWSCFARSCVYFNLIICMCALSLFYVFFILSLCRPMYRVAPKK